MMASIKLYLHNAKKRPVYERLVVFARVLVLSFVKVNCRVGLGYVVNCLCIKIFFFFFNVTHFPQIISKISSQLVVSSLDWCKYGAHMCTRIVSAFWHLWQGFQDFPYFLTLLKLFADVFSCMKTFIFSTLMQDPFFLFFYIW